MFDILFQTISLPQMENVVIRPTPEQIRNATRSIIYSPNNVNTSSCPITLEPFEEQQCLRKSYIVDVFSQDGINRWFGRMFVVQFVDMIFAITMLVVDNVAVLYKNTVLVYLCDEAGRQPTPEQTSQPTEQSEQI